MGGTSADDRWSKNNHRRAVACCRREKRKNGGESNAKMHLILPHVVFALRLNTAIFACFAGKKRKFRAAFRCQKTAKKIFPKGFELKRGLPESRNERFQKFTRQRPHTPKTKPIVFFAVNFSLKANTEPRHTQIIPVPLNSGNRTADGTRPARLVITKLIVQSETALPAAQGITNFISF